MCLLQGQLVTTLCWPGEQLHAWAEKAGRLQSADYWLLTNDYRAFLTHLYHLIDSLSMSSVLHINTSIKTTSSVEIFMEGWSENEPLNLINRWSVKAYLLKTFRVKENVEKRYGSNDWHYSSHVYNVWVKSNDHS